LVVVRTFHIQNIMEEFNWCFAPTCNHRSGDYSADDGHVFTMEHDADRVELPDVTDQSRNNESDQWLVTAFLVFLIAKDLKVQKPPALKKQRKGTFYEERQNNDYRQHFKDHGPINSEKRRIKGAINR